ncbi:MAG TPA: hypothetical protein PLT38_11115, partial [Rubrivivax sp.]|nr:hypothetical protein [Rubrivivax sp.]
MAATLAGCAQPLGVPTWTHSRADLQRLVARRFALERRERDVVDLALAAPRLSLPPERDRPVVALDLAARERLTGGRWSAHLDFDAAPCWPPGAASVRLAQVCVQDVALDAVSDSPAE